MGSEQYVETKAHWFPDFEIVKKEGVPERHARGPASAPPVGRI